MKKFLLSVLVFCFCFAVGCSDNGNNSVKNEEFEEYSSQVLSVMQDIGLITDLPDNTTGNTRATAKNVRFQQNNTIVACSAKTSQMMTFDEQKTMIWQTVQDFAEKTESDTLSFYTDIFEQTFYIPLIMGDALANYYRVSSFYGVCSNTPWNQYVKTEKDGNAKTTYVYTPAGEVFDKETFITMKLDYISQDDYVINVKQFSSNFERLFYSYLDSDGNFIVISHEDGNANNTYITYSNDGFNGYTIQDSSTVATVKDKIYDEFTNENQDAIRAVKTDSQYTVDEEKWQAAQEKYLGDSQKTHSPYVWADEEETILMGYHCYETTSEIVIPARARYLLDSFHISYNENVESTKTLIIPKTVKGIKKQENGGNVDADVSTLSIHTWDWKPLESITVEEGSTLFKAGTGHLRDLEGNIIVYANYAHPTGSIDAYDLVVNNYDLINNIAYYPRLTASITDIVYDDTTAEYGYDSDFSNFLNACENVAKLSIKTKQLTGVDIVASGNLEITVNRIADWTGLANFSVSIRDSKGGATADKLSVTLVNDDCQEFIVETEINYVNITVSLPWAQQYYEYMVMTNVCRVSVRDLSSNGGNNGMEREDVTWLFANPDGSGGGVYNLTGITVEYAGGSGLKATLDCSKANTFTIPEKYFDNIFSEIVILDNTTEDVTVNIPSNNQKIRFENVNASNRYGANITINYSGEYLSFKDMVSTEGSLVPVVTDFFVKIKCADYEGYYSNKKITVTYTNDAGDTYNPKVTVNLFEDENGVFTYRADFDNRNFVSQFEDGIVYYYVDALKNEYVLERDDSTWRMAIPFDSFEDICDLTLTFNKKVAVYNVLIEIIDEAGDITNIYERELGYLTYISIDNEYNVDVGKRFIVISMERGENADLNEAYEKIRFEIGVEQLFEIVVRGSGGTVTNDSQFAVVEDKKIEIKLISNS